MSDSTPDKLYKFCSAETAKKALSSRSLRWSSPSVFDDALELDHLTEFNFDKDILIKSVIKLSAGMIFANEYPKGDTPLINAIKRWRDDDRFASHEEAEPVLKELLSKMVDHRIEVLTNIKAAWQAYCKKTRICCFSTRPENGSAWQRFADQHRGLVIRFDASEYSIFKAPKHIEYGVVRPEITSLKDQISALLYNLKDKSTEHFEEKLLVKPPLNKLEQEWRCFRETGNPHSVSENVDEWVDDLTFERSDISAVIFGLRTEESYKKHITAIVKEDYSNAKIYQARLAKGKFDIELEKI